MISPRILAVPLPEPIQAVRSMEHQEHNVGNGFPETSDANRLLGLGNLLQQGKALRLKLRNGDFEHL